MVNAAFTFAAIGDSAPSPDGTEAVQGVTGVGRLQHLTGFAKGPLLPPRDGFSAPKI
jgi:hypothetical protein